MKTPCPEPSRWRWASRASPRTPGVSAKVAHKSCGRPSGEIDTCEPHPLFFLLAAGLSQIDQFATGALPGFTTLEIGDRAPDFDLPGVDGKQYRLKDFAAAKLLLVIFTCNHCPTAQAYEPRIMQLHADYKDRGVALVAISPNDDQAVRLDELGYTDVGDSFEDMKVRAKERGFAFPYLYDGETQKTSLAYGVVATPQVFLFDAERKLRYVGRIDDSDSQRPSPATTRATRSMPCWPARPCPSRKHARSAAPPNGRTSGRMRKASVEKWNQEPVTLQTLDEAGLAKLVKNDTENLLLINVWATTCGPCLVELPEFVTLNRMYRQRKFQMVTISMDEVEQKADALKVLKDKHVSSTNYLSAVATQDRFADLLDKEWKGPLPHTLLIAPGGKVIYRHTGGIDPLELRRAVVDYLGRTYASKAK